jgi:hypothetical protein
MATITRWRFSDRSVERLLARKRFLRSLIDSIGLYRLLEAAWPAGRRIEVTRHRIAAPVATPVRIAHVADLHIARSGARERQLLERLASERPDAIVLSGDFTDPHGDAQACGEVLRQMRAPLGVWTTLGNWDYWHPVDDWPVFLSAHGIRLLRNESAALTGDVWLAGLDSAVAGSPDPEAAVSRIPEGSFVIGLLHCPVLFDEVAHHFPIALAGHTHGGQIRIPGLPPLHMPAGCRPYADGWYQRGGSRMYVNRGIGAPGIPVRLACPPEIAMFTLEPGGERGWRSERRPIA